MEDHHTRFKNKQIMPQFTNVTNKVATRKHSHGRPIFRMLGIFGGAASIGILTFVLFKTFYKPTTLETLSEEEQAKIVSQESKRLRKEVQDERKIIAKAFAIQEGKKLSEITPAEKESLTEQALKTVRDRNASKYT
jgi:hypothetical protein